MSRAGMSGPGGLLQSGVIVRDAQPGELATIGDLRVAAYAAQGFLSDGSHYTETLRGLGRDGDGDVLVAVDSQQILGTVTLQRWPDGGNVIRGPGETEVRALAVAPGAQGCGVGRALLQAATDRASGQGAHHLVLCTQTDMLAARHLYETGGFRRLPERDWCPVPGFTLLAYGRDLRTG